MNLKRALGQTKRRAGLHVRHSRRRRSRRNPTAAKRVFLTGDAGHLGSRVADHLSNDYQVVGYDAMVGIGNTLSNYGRLKRRMAGCQYVVHAAAIPHPKKGEITDYFRVNVEGSLNVMRAAAANGVKRFIFYSSVGYYGCNIDGRLIPAYFPLDEEHPVARMSGRSEGALDAYNQSKVMAEELLAWFGTNGHFEAIAFRLAPANSKASQYPADDDEWRTNPRYRRGSFWANCHPEAILQATKAALESPRQFGYESFVICDRYAPAAVAIKAFLRDEYPDVPVRCNLDQEKVPSLFSPEKAAEILDFQPCEDVS